VGLSNAERQARFRAHKAGNHDLCAEDRECRGGKPRRRVRSTPVIDETPGPGRGAPLPLMAPPTSSARTPVEPSEPEIRSDRARELWEELAPQLSSPYRVLLVEACRMADRLDRLDSIIDGNDEWLVVQTGFGEDITVAVDSSLAEARQYATALRGLVADLVKALPAKSTTPSVKGGGIASLADAAARRRASAR
jgi:hypothetical protein